MGNRECQGFDAEESEGKGKKERRGLRQQGGFYTNLYPGRRRATLPRIKRHQHSRSGEKNAFLSVLLSNFIALSLSLLRVLPISSFKK